MNKNKYYRVREIEDASGNIVFKVETCQSWLELLFPFWRFEYTLENKTLEEAKDHIDFLASEKVVKDKIVYKTKVD